MDAEEERQAPVPPTPPKGIRVTPDDVEPFLTVKEALESRTPPTTLYHYTATAGLAGILHEHWLRLSHVSFLNDRSEMDYAKDIIDDVIQDKEQSNDDARIAKFLGVLREQMIPNMFAGLDIFVACFCADGDLLSQWRGYSKGAGMYALGFSSDGLRRPGDSGSAPYSLFPVIYDSDEQVRLVKDAVSRGIRRHLLAIQGPKDEEGEVLTALGLLTLALSFCAIMFKHGGFAAEQEWRIVLVRSKDDDHIPVLFRTDQPWYPTPYTHAIFEREAFPLTEVKCGPSPEPQLSARAVEMLLAAHRYTSVSVSNSDIPLRW